MQNLSRSLSGIASSNSLHGSKAADAGMTVEQEEKREAGGNKKKTVREEKNPNTSEFCNYKLKLRKSMARLRSC